MTIHNVTLAATTKIVCPRCHQSEAMTVSEWPGPCKQCKQSPEYLAELDQKIRDAERNNKPLVAQKFRGYRDPVAFWRDQSGRVIAQDTKGQLIPQDKTAYDINRDPHGWKTSGKKVRDRDDRGRPNR